MISEIATTLWIVAEGVTIDDTTIKVTLSAAGLGGLGTLYTVAKGWALVQERQEVQRRDFEAEKTTQRAELAEFKADIRREIDLSRKVDVVIDLLQTSFSRNSRPHDPEDGSPRDSGRSRCDSRPIRIDSEPR